MADFATHAAAVIGGYKRVQTDRGAGRTPRYVSRYEKPTIGMPGQAGGVTRAQGESNVDQTTADTAALNALNGLRKLRYGVTTAGKSGHGDDLTYDLH